MKKSSNIYIYIYKLLAYAFLILFLFFPNFIIFSTTKYLFLPTFIIMTGLLLMNYKKWHFLDNPKTIYIILLLAFLFRLIFIWRISDNVFQVSDFVKVFTNAKAGVFAGNPFYYQTAYHYILYTFLNSLLFKVFGAHQIVSLLFNMVVVFFAAIFIYKIGQKLFSSRSIANLATIIYLAWPSLFLYPLIMSPDHLCLLFILISLYLVLIIFEKLPNLTKKDGIYLLLAGITISLTGFFKNFAPVLLIALVIILILRNLKEKKILKNSLISLVLISGVFLLNNSLIFRFEENLIDAKIMKNQLSYYMYVGLGIENEGVYSANRYGEYQEYLKQNNFNMAKANKYFRHKLVLEIKNNYGKFPLLLYNKSVRNYTSIDNLHYWVKESINVQNIKEFDTNVIQPMDNIFYILVLLFSMLACVFNILQDKPNFGLLYIHLLFFGGCLMLLFAESQGRYKYALLPLLCITSAFGLYHGYDIIKKIVKKK